jgi:hypothetical protein
MQLRSISIKLCSTKTKHTHGSPFPEIVNSRQPLKKNGNYRGTKIRDPAQRGLVLRGTGGGVCDADEVGEGFAGAARMSALLGGGGGGAFLRWA